MYDIIIDISILFLLIINLIVLFYLGANIVRLRENQREFLSDILQLIQGLDSNGKSRLKGKSWDEKYEEELDDIQRRIRQDRGLVDPNQ